MTVLWGLSGFCGLSLETAWIRVVSLWAGSTVLAATLVLVVFFAAAAAGNRFGGRWSGTVRQPLLSYARFEIAAAVASGFTLLALVYVWRSLHGLPGSAVGQWSATLLLVALPSFLSGAAFPCLAQEFVAGPETRTGTAAPYYGANLLGAAAGVTGGGVLLPWGLGVKGAIAIAIGLQLLGGLIAWRVAVRCVRPGSKMSGVPEDCGKRSNPPSAPAMLGFLFLFSSGVLSLAAQVLLVVWVRQIWEGSVYAICGVLTAFIGGLGLGALAAGALRQRNVGSLRVLIIFAGAGALLLFAVPAVGSALVSREIILHARTPLALVAESVAWCTLGLLPLTFCMGGVFPVAWELVGLSGAHEGRIFGGALSLNKLGCAVGSVLGLFLLLPHLGLSGGTVALGWGYFAIAAGSALAQRARDAQAALLLPLAAFGAWQSFPPASLPVNADRSRVLASYSGAYGPVAVIEDSHTGSRQILLNSRQRLSGTVGALASQRHQSWVPLLFCKRPQRVLTIGMAAGISATAALDFPVRELEAVELVPEVVEAGRAHFAPWNGPLFSDPRARVAVGDGRIALARSRVQYDAIICDLFFPAEDGSAHFYSRDFFAAARQKLEPGGVFCIWLPCYQHTAETAGIIIRTFIDAFPHAIAVRTGFDPLHPVIGLIGAAEAIPMSESYLATQLSTAHGRAIAQRSPFFISPMNALLLLVGDLHAADPGFGGHPIATDDRPLLAWIGPRFPRAGERLIGFPFLQWMGSRFLALRFPSCEFGATSPQAIHASIRAANYYFAAAAANVALPGDRRSESTRLQQVASYLQRARQLSPKAEFPADALGE